MAVLAIVATTAVPSELRLAYTESLIWRIEAPDIVLNLLLYFPLGVALYRRRAPTLLLIAIALSASIELLQMFYIGRYASVLDVAMNTLGALLGFIVAQALKRAKGWSLDTLGLD